MNWIEVNGVCLRYELSGGGATTLVLVHEMGGTLESWEGCVRPLNTTRQLLRYDTRGAGLSEKIHGRITWDEMADDLGALLDAMGVAGPVSIAGMAVGAGVAMHFAVKNPARVAALILHGPATGVAGDHREAALNRATTVVVGGMRAVMEFGLAASYPPAMRQDPERFREFRARWLGNDPDSFGAITRMLAEHPITDELSQVRCPTLVTAGRHDPVRTPAVVESMARRIPGAKFLELDSAHVASVQTPEIMAEAIHSFLRPLGQ